MWRCRAVEALGEQVDSGQRVNTRAGTIQATPPGSGLLSKARIAGMLRATLSLAPKAWGHGLAGPVRNADQQVLLCTSHVGGLSFNGTPLNGWP